ncbi:MAG: hypothetical protein K2X03_25960 [Bryobacteraceae bacterium]|nr:hypothetical protein [Bryobacteraceae bacterium]
MENSNNQTPANKWVLPAMGAALALSLGFNAYQGSRLQTVDQQVTSVNGQLAEIRQGLSKVEAQTGTQISTLRGDMTTVKSEAEKIAKDAAKGASWTAQSLAQRHADQLAAKLGKEVEGNQKVVAELNTELAAVKSTTQQTSTELNNNLTNVSTDVKRVRTDVDATRTELQSTIADLRRATGDMGVMSGLIATNSNELKALRELGERNYFEFRITRNDKAQKVGDVTLALKKADPKKSRFTLELNADDRKIEKKDKTMNEPVQFYVASKARQPYEIVVNEITKDTVVGYLSTPKVQVARK